MLHALLLPLRHLPDYSEAKQRVQSGAADVMMQVPAAQTM